MCDSQEIEILSDEGHMIKTWGIMYEFMMQQKLCDVEVLVNGQHFWYHANVLAACSEHLNIELTENQKDKPKKKITIQDMDADAVQRIFHFCYTGKIELKKNAVNNILSVAINFGIQPVIQMCCRFLTSTINIENCLSTYELSKLPIHSFGQLEISAAEFIGLHFLEVTSSAKFVQLDVRTLSDLIKLDYVGIASEIEVFEAVKRWVQHDNNNRKQYIDSLMEIVRLPLLPQEYLFQEVQPFCNENSKCQKFILEAIQWQTIPKNKAQLSSIRTEPRSPLNTIMIVGAWTLNSSSIIEIYDPITRSWSQLFDLKIERRNYSVVRVDEELLLIGGFSTKVYSDLESFNLTTGERKSLKPMQVERDHPAVAMLGDFLYAAGGNNHSAILATVERYDFVKNVWTYVESMSTARCGFGYAVLNNELYVVGGSTGAASSITEAFNPISGKWKLCASMNVKRTWPGVASLGCYLYVVGGRKLNSNIEKYSSVERYDPIADKWTFIADISSARYGITGGSFGGNIFAIAGADGTDVLTIVEEYDIEKKEWKIVAPLNSTREISNFIQVPWKMIKNSNLS